MLEKTSGLLAVDDRSKEDIEQAYSILLGEKVTLDSVRRLIVTHGYMSAEKVVREYLLVSTSGNWYLVLEMGGPHTAWHDCEDGKYVIGMHYVVMTADMCKKYIDTRMMLDQDDGKNLPCHPF